MFRNDLFRKVFVLVFVWKSLLFHGVISILEYRNINPHAEHALTQHEIGVYLSSKGAQQQGAGPRFVSHPVKFLTQKQKQHGP